MGCRGDPDLPDLLDTGWFTAEDAPGCPHTVVESAPEDGVVSWFYLDVPRVFTSTTDIGGYEAWLSTAEGHEVPTTMAWSVVDSAFDLVPEEPLPPGTDFELVVQDCERTTTVRFSTSELGLPLYDGALGLAGRTYRLDLGGARWVQPQGLSAIIAAFLSEPILLGVVYADEQRIDLLGAPSSVDGIGRVSQADAPTWDFPLADFDPARPTFSINADSIEMLIVQNGSDAAIPVSGFTLSGTLSSDGERLGGGTLSGTADTREFAEAFLRSEDAICELARDSFQLSCEPCPSDGAVFCLNLVATAMTGTRQTGLTLVTRDP